MTVPRILYYCYDSNRPTGGEKHSYQHVDILNAHGFEAYAIHQAPGFRLTWFDNTTRVTSWQEIQHDQRRDIVVLPENMGLRIGDIPGTKVIFNKNLYYGFDSLGLSREGARTYMSDDVIAVLSVSPHNQEYLQFAYPNKPVLLVRPNIRPDAFAHRPLSAKRFQIAYAAKASLHGRMLYQLLQGRAACGLNRTMEMRWVPIVDLQEHEVIATLQETLLFVFLSVHEGLPRLPLEAMACGCLVCAYDCGPAAIYLPSAYRFVYGDLLAMARHIERISNAFPAGLDDCVAVTEGARRIAEQYSAQEQERSVVNAWTNILDSHRWRWPVTRVRHQPVRDNAIPLTSSHPFERHPHE